MLCSMYAELIAVSSLMFVMTWLIGLTTQLLSKAVVGMIQRASCGCLE